MAFIDFKFFSEALGMQTECYVVLPQKSSRGEIGIDNNREGVQYKCLYLLHGLSDDHTIWLRRTNIERYATEYGICVVMPCGHRSFYTDMKQGGKYYTYIAKELPRIIREFFRVSDKREDTFIAGNSMGGYGALKIALKEHDTFGAAAGLSTAADVRSRSLTAGREELWKSIWGDPMEIPDEDDLFCLAEQYEKCPNRPRLYMAVGTEDYLYEDNVKLRNKITGLDYDYIYKEGPGAHNWAFWDTYIQDVLEWMFRTDAE